MPRAITIRASSFLFVAAMAGGLGAAPFAFFACSTFDSTAGADADGGGPEAEPAEAANEDVRTEASGDGAATCGALASGDLLKGGWTLGGSATNTGNFVVLLTDSVASRRGFAWHAVDLAPMQSFRATFTLRVTTRDVAPADGVTFFWSGDATPVLGSDGNRLGFCGGADGGGVNGGAVSLATDLVPLDADGGAASKVSVKHNQAASCVDDGQVATTEPLAAADAGTVTAAIVISLDGPAHTITVRRDGKTVIDHQALAYVPDQIQSIGFTAATGNNYAAHEISDVTLTSCP